MVERGDESRRKILGPNGSTVAVVLVARSPIGKYWCIQYDMACDGDCVLSRNWNECGYGNEFDLFVWQVETGEYTHLYRMLNGQTTQNRISRRSNSVLLITLTSKERGNPV